MSFLLAPQFNLLTVMVLMGFVSLGWYVLYLTGKSEWKTKLEKVEAELAEERVKREQIEKWLTEKFPNEYAR